MVVCLVIITVTLIKGVYWPDVGWYLFKRVPDAISIIISEIKNPMTVDKVCMLGGGGVCCDKNDPNSCGSTMRLSPANYCYKYLQACRVEADGHCGWNSKEIDRERQCEDNHEYPNQK